MSTNYVPSNQEGNFFSNAVAGLLMTLGIFVVLPAMHLLGGMFDPSSVTTAEQATIEPPPPPPDDLPPPPEDQQEIEKPDIEEPPPPMTLAQLEMALNPGSGNAAGDFGFTDFQANIDAAATMKIFDIGDLDQRPGPIFQTSPKYPYALKQSRVDGWVDLEWVITDKGTCIRIRAIRSSHREFEQPAIESIARSKWKPGKKDNKKVNTRVRQRMDFNSP